MSKGYLLVNYFRKIFIEKKKKELKLYLVTVFVFLYFWNKKHVWLVEIKKNSFLKKKIENTKICCYEDLKSNANSLNKIDSLNQMCVFIKFWILKTENKFLHVFSFLHKLSFKNSFCFLFILGCQTNFLVSKIETKSKKKK